MTISHLLHVTALVLITFCGIKLFAEDVITVYNHADVPVYLAFYYVKSTIVGVSIGPAAKSGESLIVPPYQSVKLVRPPWKIFSDNRELIFSTSPETLKKELSAKEYNVSSHKAAGVKYGNIYHIAKVDGVVSVHGDVDWKLFEPMQAGIKDIAVRVFHETADFFKQHPYANIKATIRQGNDLGDDEIKSVSNRRPKTKTALESILKVSLPENAVPRIGIAMSGGGVRAATCAYGFIAGLNEIGLLDAVTYAVGLSGSTWLISSFLELGKSVGEYRQEFLQAITQEHLLAPSAITDTFLQKFVYNQPMSIVDLYGVYLSNKFFRNIDTDIGRQRVWFSDVRNRVTDGSLMFPLCTAVEISRSKSKPIWFTFSPFEVGSDELGLYVPTWALGRKFLAGVSTDLRNPPELRLGFFMGLWSSALSSTFQYTFDVGVKKYVNNLVMRTIIKNVLKQTIGPLQFAPINIANPFYGIQSVSYKDLEELTFVDAGLAYNLPITPLLNNKRGVDIIVVLDASGKVHAEEGAGELRKAENHIRKLGLAFPKIDYTGITTQAVHVFVDADPGTPIVLYVVPVKNVQHTDLGDPAKEFQTTYQTSNFKYSKRDAERLIDLMRYNIVDNKEMIIDAIKQKINQKMKH